MAYPIQFSKSATYTVLHAKNYISKYKTLFNWTEQEDILEIGCASGRITKDILYPFVKKYCRHLTGADISEDAVRAANESNDFPNLSFEKIDIKDKVQCSQYEMKFQHIFAFYTLHMVHRCDLWSQNIHKMLKPNGQFFASIVMKNNLFTTAMTAQKEDKSKPWSKYIENLPDYFFDFGSEPIKYISNLLSEAGFVINAIDFHPKEMNYKDVEQLKEHFVSVNTFLRHIPDELHQEYTDDYLKKMFQLVIHENGSYLFRLDVVTLLATKI